MVNSARMHLGHRWFDWRRGTRGFRGGSWGRDELIDGLGESLVRAVVALGHGGQEFGGVMGRLGHLEIGKEGTN